MIGSMSIAERLREARAKLGISQVEAGKRLGLSGQGYGKWENGKATPRGSEFAYSYDFLH